MRYNLAGLNQKSACASLKRRGICFAGILLILIPILFPVFRPRQTVIVSFVGDILLDRGVRTQMEENGFSYPFLKLSTVFDSSDIVCGNLEGPITGGGIPSFKDPRYIFQFPPEMTGHLAQAGFNLLNLANNHTMDHGAKGLLDTIETLGKHNIRHIGGGTSRQAASEPVFIDVRGTRLGFLSYSAFPPEGYFYTEDKPNISMLDLSALGASVQEAKKQCDFLTVSFHWGREFDPFPGEDQKAAAKLAIDHGADIIIGHHPHVFQGVEQYQGKMIFYSLGNFVFDRQIPPRTDETVIVNLHIKMGNLKTIEVLPVKITDCQPEVLTGEAANTLLNRLFQYSVLKPEVKNGVARLKAGSQGV